jgi:hypothetical protein
MHAGMSQHWIATYMRRADGRRGTCNVTRRVSSAFDACASTVLDICCAVVNKRLRPTAVLALVRKHSSRRGFTVQELPGRGKGSHRLYVVLDADELEVGRIAVPDHRRELSWTVLHSVESALAHEFGERWMEEQ